MYMASVYASPNGTVQEYEDMLDSLAAEMNTLKGSTDEKIVMGDFNAKSPLWCADAWCSRGRKLFEFCNVAELFPVVTKGGATCDRGRGIKIDIMSCNRRALQDLTGSVFIEDYSASDHKYVVHTFQLAQHKGETASPFEIEKGKLDEEGFVEAFLKKFGDKNFDKRPRTHTTLEVYKFLEEMSELVNRYTRYGGARSKRTPVPWWNSDIAEKRKLAQKASRRLTRVRAGIDHEAIEKSTRAYKKCKMDLNTEIRKAKRNSWANLLQEVDKDVWGRPYKLVLRAVKQTSSVSAKGGPQWTR
uniref:uncharacterized protein LOC117611311 n=1 Tax=Osmia lignaria TaxID=473952 RepID=UPI0014793C98|nr:uncharacterized protein LOC117611311 [Osmia lignaria]